MGATGAISELPPSPPFICPPYLGNQIEFQASEAVHAQLSAKTISAAAGRLWCS